MVSHNELPSLPLLSFGFEARVEILHRSVDLSALLFGVINYLCVHENKPEQVVRIACPVNTYSLIQLLLLCGHMLSVPL